MEDHLCRDRKSVFDSIHGTIELTEFAIKIIDSPIFQRLRSLKQLGTCNYIFQNGVHTRFEHSIGTYHLARKLLDQLNKNIGEHTDPIFIDNYLASIKELEGYYSRTYDNKAHILDVYVCELIKIAALCHDIGHGPFSHVFDDVFIPMTESKHSIYATHEMRSCALLRRIIQSDSVLSAVVTDDEITFMCNLINPSKEHSGFIYQIVSNSFNSLDVDKYDYLTRDSKVLNIKTSFDFNRLIESAKIVDNIICYSERTLYDILNLFETRHYLHRQVYGHKGVIAAQYVISEILTLIDPILKISSSVDDLDKFVSLTDDYILNSVSFLQNYKTSVVPEQYWKNVDNASSLLTQLTNHILYTCIDITISEEKLVFTVDDLLKYYNGTHIEPSDILIFTNRVGYVSGNKGNPLDNIYIYRTKDMYTVDRPKAIKCDKGEITKLMPPMHQECITIIFYKKKYDTENIIALKQCAKSLKDKFYLLS
jgi:HD superfamily phosphohydrolase